MSLSTERRPFSVSEHQVKTLVRLQTRTTSPKIIFEHRLVPVAGWELRITSGIRGKIRRHRVRIFSLLRHQIRLEINLHTVFLLTLFKAHPERGKPAPGKGSDDFLSDSRSKSSFSETLLGIYGISSYTYLLSNTIYKITKFSERCEKPRVTGLSVSHSSTHTRRFDGKTCGFGALSEPRPL